MLLPLLIIFIISCNFKKDNKVADFELQNKIALPIPEEILNSSSYLYTYPYSVKYIEDEQQLLVNYYNFNYLYVYDLKSRQLLNKINFPRRFNFDNVEYINKDSILLFLSGVDKYYYDTSIVVINYTGKIKSAYGIKHENILNYSTCDLQKLDQQTYLSYLFPIYCFDNICYKNNVYFALNCAQEKFLENKFISVYGSFDLASKNVSINNQLTYPVKKPISTFNFPENILKTNINIVPEKAELLVSFAFSPYVYKHDLDKDKGVFVCLNSKLPDTSWVYQADKNGHTYFYGKVSFVEPINKYIRFVTLKVNDEIIRSIVTYDEKFNYIGEMLTDLSIKTINGKYFSADIVHDSLIISEYRPVEAAFDATKLEHELKKKIPKPTQNLETCNLIKNNSIEKRNIIDYLKMKALPLDTSYSVIVLNENGCTSCNEYFINFLSINSFLLKKKSKPLFFIYISNNKEASESFFRKKKMENILIDQPNNYNPFHPFKYFNPRLVLVRNNKIISDTVYIPDQLERLVERLLIFYGAVI